MMTVHCISARRNHARRVAFIENWRAAGFEVRFHIANDFRDFPRSDCDRLVALSFCLMAHVKVWRDLAGVGGYSLIAEDDAIPLAGIHEGISLAGDSPYQVVKLFHEERDGRVGVVGLRDWISATCYLARDTGDLFARRLEVGSPDRLLSMIASVGGICPVVAQPTGPSLIPLW
jgi:hypothetical protein